jgi:hypothetical protein
MKLGKHVTFDTDPSDTTVTRARTTIAKLIEEGDLCPHCFMEPVAFQIDGDSCSCHIVAPCAACEGSYLACPSCGWRQDDEVD